MEIYPGLSLSNTPYIQGCRFGILRSHTYTVMRLASGQTKCQREN